MMRVFDVGSARWICLGFLLAACSAPARADGGAEEGATEASEQSGESAPSEKQLRERLRRLEAKYKETGNPRFKFERVLMLEKMGEYEFALEVLQNHRDEFVSSSEVQGVAVVEQRLRDEVNGAGGGGGGSDGGGQTDVLGGALVGGGGAAAAGGVASLLVANSKAERLRCSPSSEGPSADGCGGVDEYRGLSQSEFDDKSSTVTTLRVLGAGLAAVGVGAAGWGVYRLVAGTTERRTADGRAEAGGVKLRPSIWTGGAKLQLRVAF